MEHPLTCMVDWRAATRVETDAILRKMWMIAKAPPLAHHLLLFQSLEPARDIPVAEEAVEVIFITADPNVQ